MSSAVPSVDGARVSQRRQLPEEVASYVRSLIFSGSVRPGEFLRLEPIAEALGVSNTPVREGLLSLKSEGFVELVPRRGFMVAPFSKQDIRDLFWVQAQLASELAARAAKKITAEQLDKLESTVERHAQAIVNNDRAQISDLGHRFHAIINRSADSHRLALLLDSVVRHLPDRFYATIDAQVEAARDTHPIILDALRDHNARTVRKLMDSHILEEADHLIAILDERGLWAEQSQSAS